MVDIEQTITQITTDIPMTECADEIFGALDHLKSGGVVVSPTDTLYGLVADVFNQDALERVFTIKGRASDLALPVLISDWAMVGVVAGPGARGMRRIFRSLPGIQPRTSKSHSRTQSARRSCIATFRWAGSLLAFRSGFLDFYHQLSKREQRCRDP